MNERDWMKACRVKEIRVRCHSLSCNTLQIRLFVGNIVSTARVGPAPKQNYVLTFANDGVSCH
jgi:hypothetical protein